MKRHITDLALIVLLIVGIAYVVAKIPSSSSSSTPTSVSTITPSTNSNTNTPSTNSQPTQPKSSTSPNNVTTSSESNVSANWAGYVSTGGSYSTVSGSWAVPQVSSSDITSSDATWIGIGGVSSSDLIQVGTQNIVAPNGQIQSSAFYEMLPEDSVDISTITLNPGDSVSASINELSDGQWGITIVDNTNGQSFSTTVDYGSSNSSAEWIEEDPSDGVSLIPLDDFGTVTFTSASTTDNGTKDNLSSSQAQPILMQDSYGQTMASPSAISSSGSSFGVTYSDTASQTGISQFDQNPWSFIRQGSGIGGFSFGGF